MKATRGKQRSGSGILMGYAHCRVRAAPDEKGGVKVGSSSEQPMSESVEPAAAPEKRKMSKTMLAIIIVVILVIAAIAGALWAGLFNKEKTAEKVLIIAMSSDVETMNPARTSAMYGPPGMIYETLVARDLTTAYVPGLAESWNWDKSDPANPTLTFHLKHGVMYHDGTAFNSTSVKRTLDWYAQNDSWVNYEFYALKNCPSYYDTTDYSGWPDVAMWTKDEYTLQLNLTWADVALIFNLSHLYGSMIGPDALWAEGLDDYGNVQHKDDIVGTGPFMLSEWIAGDHITLVKNPNYTWGASWYSNKGPANIDKIIYRIMPDEAARFAAFESGDVDVLMQVPPNKVQSYDSNPDMTVITGPGQGTYHVEFNCNKDPWSNPYLRLGFAYAINRTQILQTVWHGYGEEGVNYLSPIEPESRNVPAQYNFTYDTARALANFSLAGWSDTDDDGWLENSSGEELSLHLWTTNKGEDVSMSEIIKTQFEAVGVHVTLAQYQETELRTRADAGEQDAILFWYSWPRAEILDWHFGTWAAGGSNTGWYMDPVFDGYVVNWTLAQTEQEFSDNATAGHIRLLTQAPWAPILFWHQIVAVHNYVTGWYVHPLGQEQTIDITDVDINK
jgi:peptide/nickel transport system substrate-binding protein